VTPDSYTLRRRPRKGGAHRGAAGANGEDAGDDAAIRRSASGRLGRLVHADEFLVDRADARHAASETDPLGRRRRQRRPYALLGHQKEVVMSSRGRKSWRDKEGQRTRAEVVFIELVTGSWPRRRSAQNRGQRGPDALGLGLESFRE
jgi:hypothetical protein